MKNLTIASAAAACGGVYCGPDDPELLQREISFLTTDSRAAGEGCLFAAIVGSRVDGHDYIPSAMAKGALAVLCQRRPEDASVPTIVVDSTEAALQDIAAFYRAQFDMPVVGVTGSVGKTTTKEMIASVLSQRMNVLKTEKNFNNELGVPFTLFRLQPEHEAAVVEMGISGFGEMTRLARMAQPTMAVYTVIGWAHLEFLGDRAGVLRAKTEMLAHMAADAPVFVNGDDEYLAALTCRQPVTRFGLSEGCQVRALDVRSCGTDGMTCCITAGERRIPVRIAAWGAHLVYAALAAAAVGLHMGLSDEEIAAGIAAYAPVGSRGGVLHTDRWTVLDDCYNSNPSSAQASVTSLATLPGRRVCILGDMLELGEQSAALHRQLGEFAARKGIDVIIACGVCAEQIYSGAISISQGQVWYFPNKQALFDALPQLLQDGDSILVKASHGEHFGEIVQWLTEEH